MDSYNIGSDRFTEFHFSWKYIYFIVPLVMFFLILLIYFQIDYSFIYELDSNLYTTGSSYLLMWNYSFGDYQYPGKFTFDDFKNYMQSNFLTIGIILSFILLIALYFVLYIFQKSRIPNKNAQSYEITNVRGFLPIWVLIGFFVIGIATILLGYNIADATMSALSLNNYIDKSASTPAEAISLSDYQTFVKIYNFYTDISMYAIGYALLVLIGFFIITYFGFTLINRAKGIILIQDNTVLFPEFTISKNTAGIKQTFNNWKKIPISAIKEFNFGHSTEYFSGRKVISSYWIGNTHYTQSQESSYSRKVSWIIFETFELGNFAVPIVFSRLSKKTINNESVGKIFLERFNYIGFSSQSINQFLLHLKPFLSSYDLQKKVEQFSQTINSTNLQTKV